VDENYYLGAGSVRYVQLNGNGNERSEPITSARIRGPSRLCKRISCYAELVVVLVNRVIPTVRNALQSANNSLIERGKNGITEKPQNM
jgi:hypothetical protein